LLSGLGVKLESLSRLAANGILQPIFLLSPSAFQLTREFVQQPVVLPHLRTALYLVYQPLQLQVFSKDHVWPFSIDRHL
jgi:hypothetical protein